MATPAEIIAARVNGTYVADSYAPRKSASPALDSGDSRSLSDASAFPVLGGGSRSSAGSSVSTSWGPQSNGKVAASVAAAPQVKASAPAGKLRLSTRQEAFSLDAEDQLNVARPEFIKILTEIKTSTQTSIECTTSQHTKKRTFLIRGKLDQVKLAKKLVIKKLTKPVLISFAIPSKLRAKVIGAQGRNLKPIIKEHEVKVDIGSSESSASPDAVDDDDDVWSHTVQVTVEGSADSCKLAKAQLLAIVNEDLKSSQIKVPLASSVKPFATVAVKEIVEKYQELDFTIPPFDSSSQAIIIHGDRQVALAAKADIKEVLDALAEKVVVEEIEVAPSMQQLLPVEKFLEEDFVLLETSSKTGSLQLIGEKDDVRRAKQKVKDIISSYRVEVLDMAKAHRGNIPHVRAVAALFIKYGVFDSIASEYEVQINSPKLSEENSIPVEIVVSTADAEVTKNARRAIVAAVNKVTPDQTLVVSDIDSFFFPKVPAILNSLENTKYVILDESLILFDYSPASESDDFADFEEDLDTKLAAANSALDELRKLQQTYSTTVLEISSADQAHVNGPNGSTLRSILSGLDADSIEVKLHTNKAGVSKNEVLIRGLTEVVARVEKDIKEIVAEAKEYDATGGYKAQLEVPTFVLSRVIGKGGSNLNSIRDEFGVKIDIEGDARDSESADKSMKTQIVISGIKRNAEGAKAAISALAKKLADDTLLRMRIENEYHRRIIGPNFSLINRLQDRYNVKIRFPSENGSQFADAPRNEDEVTVRGPSKNVARAEEELKQLLKFERENGYKTTIKIPSAAIARVIGKNGETIGDIADGTGVDYRFKRDREQEEAQGFAEVDLTGAKSAIQEAEKKIQEIVKEVENFVSVTLKVNPKYHRDLVGPSGSVLREIILKAGGENLSRQQYSRLLTIPNEGSDSDEVVCQGNKEVVNKIVEQIKRIVADKEASVKEDYELAKEKHKLIVGPGGSIRHSLQDEFGVQISIPQPSSTSTVIVLHGLPEKIEKLRVKLNEMTKDNWNESIDIPVSRHSLISDRGALIKLLRVQHNVEVSHGNLNRKATKLSSSSNPAPPEPFSGEGATEFVTAPLATDASAEVIPWRLVGEEAATAAAAKTIMEQLEKAQAATTAGWFYSSNPAAHFPKIIGAQGAKIKKIRESTGAFISVPRTNESHSNVIYMVGTEESVAKASEQLKSLL